MKTMKKREKNEFREFIRMKMLREKQVKDITGLSRATRWRMERKGLFPKRVQLTARCVGWPEGEILNWLKSRSEAR